MRLRDATLLSASVLAILLGSDARAQTTPAPGEQSQADREQPAASSVEDEEEIVITGSIRRSLERAAEIKREATQVVDSIVAEDIGKFPDPTTAAALQRVPGVQVQVGGNNEIVNVLIRGLNDIQTTLDERELFSTTGRGFQFQDLPAEALARVDIIKSNTANLIEGGIAGVANLRLNKPFNFRDPTIVLSARGNYALNVEEVNPQFSALVTDRWETGIGEIGALLNVSWSHTDYNRPNAFVAVRRSTAAAPFRLPGFSLTNVAAGRNDYGSYERPQANASIQWQATPELEVYLDGLYAGYRGENQTTTIEAQLFNPGVGIQNPVAGDACYTARVAGNGFNAGREAVLRGEVTPQNPTGGYTVQDLCDIETATFTDVPAFTGLQARKQETNNYLGALGARYEGDRLSLLGDVAYQTSVFEQEIFGVGIGKRIPTVVIETDVENGGRYSTPGLPLNDPAGLTFRNGLNQNFSRDEGDLLQARVDGSYELDGFIQLIQLGARFADRSATANQVLINTPSPGGDLVTPIASAGLGDDFLATPPGIPRINDGGPRLVPNPDYLRTDEGRDALRRAHGLPEGDPDFQPQRRFDATEKTYAAYAQVQYEFGVGPTVEVDGVVGARLTKTDRTIEGASQVTIPAVPATPTTPAIPARTEVQPFDADTSETDLLPNASARVRFGGGLQARLTYAKTIRRPAFDSLNPGISYVIATNPGVQNTGSAGNPDLRPQKSDSYDATLEYYFDDSSFVAAGVYYRDITDRVITTSVPEVIDGITYNIARPRNVGAARLQGIELSGQTFFDFLPGVLGGLGAFGNFTYADTEVKGDDPLAGLPLQGVSKYNYNIGLLYERGGLSARAVYTFRSSYYNGDATTQPGLRPIDAELAADPDYVPRMLTYVRPAGRLDFSVGYDLTDNLRVDVGGTNVLRSRYKSYFAEPFLNNEVLYDDTTYTAGVRARF